MLDFELIENSEKSFFADQITTEYYGKCALEAHCPFFRISKSVSDLKQDKSSFSFF